MNIAIATGTGAIKDWLQFTIALMFLPIVIKYLRRIFGMALRSWKSSTIRIAPSPEVPPLQKLAYHVQRAGVPVVTMMALATICIYSLITVNVIYVGKPPSYISIFVLVIFALTLLMIIPTTSVVFFNRPEFLVPKRLRAEPGIVDLSRR